MTSTVDALILDLLEWIAAAPRSYEEVMEAWRTSCPRLPVWEDASDRGFVVRERSDGQGVRVLLTPAGREFLTGKRTRPARSLLHQCGDGRPTSSFMTAP